MIAHRVIDALLERRGKLVFSDEHLHVTPDIRAAAAKRIELAEKFDFGALVLERNEDETWALPNLTDDEHEFLAEGLIPLPFDSVWYEFKLGSSWTGLLVESARGGTDWVAERIDVTDDGVIYDNIAVCAPLAEQRKGFKMKVVRNELLARQLRTSEQFMNSNVGVIIPLVAYLTLMLLSRTTIVERGFIPLKLNWANVRRGYTPLPPHRVVRIVPTEYRYERDASGRLTERRSPRLHWRRSHLRTYASGRRVVIARMLVGRAELGEVSHEYKVEERT